MAVDMEVSCEGKVSGERMTNDQIPMAKIIRWDLVIGHWDLVIDQPTTN
jgi:hypothetical protein